MFGSHFQNLCFKFRKAPAEKIETTILKNLQGEAIEAVMLRTD